MKYIIIDDNENFAKTLCGQLLKRTNEESNGKTCNEKQLQLKQGDETITIDYTKHNVAQIADAIIETYGKEEKKLPDDAVIFINVNLKTKDGNRQEQKGIELLIWLRIKEVMNHCVMYSFETVHQLLQRKPKHLILTSKGTSFVQLPSDFELNFDKLNKEKAEEDNLKNTLKAYFNKDNRENIDVFKHKGANWWGLKALCEVHKVVENELKFTLPAHIDKELLDVNNAVAKYIYQHRQTEIEEIVKQETNRRQKFIETLKSQLEKLGKIIEEKKAFVEIGKEEIDVKNICIQEINSSLLNYMDSSLIEYRQRILKEIEEINSLIAPEQVAIKVSDDEKNQKEAALLKKKEGYENILSVITKELNSSSKYYDGDIKLKIKGRKLKIIYIDDNAQNGWNDILSQMILEAIITSIVPKEVYKNDIEKLYANQVKETINNDLSLIMLDLRLYDEKDRSVAVENLSGKKLLDIIRKNHKGIPVLIITASNKVWSYEELMKSGADAYWMKEGIDNHFEVKESVDNYYKLLWLVEKLTNDEYAFLRKITDKIERLACVEEHWWQDMCWNFEYKKNNKVIVPNETKAERKVIFDILWDAQSFLKSYLKATVLKIGSENYSEQKWFLPAEIIRHLGNIIEIIHDFETMRINYQDLPGGQRLKYTPDGKIGINGWMNNSTTEIKPKFRGDTVGAELYDARNKASHYAEAKNKGFKELKIVFTKLLDYLDINPQVRDSLETLNENP